MTRHSSFWTRVKLRYNSTRYITLHSFREITYLTALRGRGRVSRRRRCRPRSGTVIRSVGARATPLHHLIGSLLLLIVQLQQLLLLLLQLLLLEAGLHFRIIRFEFRHVAAQEMRTDVARLRTSARMWVHGYRARVSIPQVTRQPSHRFTSNLHARGVSKLVIMLKRIVRLSTLRRSLRVSAFCNSSRIYQCYL